MYFKNVYIYSDELKSINMFKIYVYIQRNAQIDEVIPMYKDVYVIKMCTS